MKSSTVNGHKQALIMLIKKLNKTQIEDTIWELLKEEDIYAKSISCNEPRHVLFNALVDQLYVISPTTRRVELFLHAAVEAAKKMSDAITTEKQ